MAKVRGRIQLLKIGGTTVAGVRTLSMSVDNTPIDVTDADSNGYQELLPQAGSKVMTITVAGVETDEVLRNLAVHNVTAPLVTDMTLTFADALVAVDILAGNFFLTNYKEDADYKDAVMFSCTFTSSGAWSRS